MTTPKKKAPRKFIVSQYKNQKPKVQFYDTTPNWKEDLEKLALTKPDPHQALYNLPQLKGFISSLLESIIEEVKKEKRELDVRVEGRLIGGVVMKDWLGIGINVGLETALEVIKKRI